jgi:hypothetical protein
MDTATQIVLEKRDSLSVASKRDEALRALWATPKAIPAIASVMEVGPCYVRARAEVLGLKQRSQLSLTG